MTPSADILRTARVLLLDFDGPVCSIFAGYPAAAVAEELRKVIASCGDAIPTEVRDSDHPLRMLRQLAGTSSPDTLRVVADALREAELTAAQTATPTPGVDELLRAARDANRRVAIVSNNSTEAVRAYVGRHALDVDHISGRYYGMDPRSLKPSRHLVNRALAALVADPDNAVFIGDSAEDVAAGLAAGVPVIGYANKPGKRPTLTEAGAAAIVESLAELSSALRGG